MFPGGSDWCFCVDTFSILFLYEQGLHTHKNTHKMSRNRIPYKSPRLKFLGKDFRLLMHIDGSLSSKIVLLDSQSVFEISNILIEKYYCHYCFYSGRHVITHDE